MIYIYNHDFRTVPLNPEIETSITFVIENKKQNVWVEEHL